MKPTKVLTDSYVLYNVFDPRKYKKAQTLIFGACMLVGGVSYVFFSQLASILRTDFAGHIGFNPTFSPINIVVMLIAILIILFAHELVHGLLLWLFTGERPAFVIGLSSAHVEAKGWYLPRNVLLTTVLAPLCSLSLIGLVLLFLVPKDIVGLLILGLAVNTGGSVHDMAVSAFISLQPTSCYLTTTCAIYIEKPSQALQGLDGEPGWKTQARLFVERILSNLK